MVTEAVEDRVKADNTSVILLQLVEGNVAYKSSKKEGMPPLEEVRRENTVDDEMMDFLQDDSNFAKI